MPKPLALPNVTPDAIAIEAHRLYGAQLQLEAETLRFDQVKREVAEHGVDPQILLIVLHDSRSDQTKRIIRERSLAQYSNTLRAPTLRYEVDLLEEPEPETAEERQERIRNEGFWAFITHREEGANPYSEAADAGDWLVGWKSALELIGGVSE